MLILGFVWSKMKKNKYVLETKKKSLLYKSILTFFLGGLEKKIRAHLYFFIVLPSGAIPATKTPQNYVFDGENGFSIYKHSKLCYRHNYS